MPTNVFKTKSYIFNKGQGGKLYYTELLQFWSYQSLIRFDTSRFSNYLQINSDARFIDGIFALIPNTLIFFCIMSANLQSVSVFSDIYDISESVSGFWKQY